MPLNLLTMLPPPAAPVDLVRPGLDEHAPGFDWIPWLVVSLAILTLVAGGVFAMRWWRRQGAALGRRVTHALPTVRVLPAPEWWAFQDLSRRLGLTHRHRAALSRLGRLTDAPPVALVLSEHALDTALARLDLRAVAENIRPDERIIAEARRLAFAETAAAATP